MKEVELQTLEPEWFEGVLEPEAKRRFLDALDQARRILEGRSLWHVNSTARGGGVAEILHSALGYLRGAGLHPRWMVIRGNGPFYDLTKRLHNLLHGDEDEDGDLTEDDRRVYEDVLEPQGEELSGLVEAGDVVVIHDPQPLALVPALRRRGAKVIWNCHVGIDEPNGLTRSAWDFLRPYAAEANAQVFSRQAYAWEGLSADTVNVIPPCIDAFSAKNQDMDEETVHAILGAAGLIQNSGRGTPVFTRVDRSPGEVSRRAEMTETGSVPPSAPIVLQVSRWDRLKDPVGVVRGFAEHVPEALGAHLFLAGPASGSVTDDPEAGEVMQEVRKVAAELPQSSRERVHLANVPMDDLEENAAIINALQRRANVIVQKSLAEGFGLTVTEGMWKARPMVGSRVGGIQDQIEDGRTGLLVDDPEDLAEFGAAVTSLLADRDRAIRMGVQARHRVLDEYLVPRYLTRYVELIDRVAAIGRRHYGRR